MITARGDYAFGRDAAAAPARTATAQEPERRFSREWPRYAVCGPESGRQFVKSLPRSLGAPFPQPATAALDVRAQKLHPLVRRGLYADAIRGLPALARPAAAGERNERAGVRADATYT